MPYRIGRDGLWESSGRGGKPTKQANPLRVCFVILLGVLCQLASVSGEEPKGNGPNSKAAIEAQRKKANDFLETARIQNQKKIYELAL